MLNQTAEYALRAVTFLASRAPEDRVRATELARALGLPANYLSKILHQLVGAGVLESRRGRSGGFRLARRADTLSLLRVVRPFDAIGSERRCVLGGSLCSDHRACSAHERWRPISTAVHTFLRDTTVAQLVRPDGRPPTVDDRRRRSEVPARARRGRPRKTPAEVARGGRPRTSPG